MQAPQRDGLEHLARLAAVYDADQGLGRASDLLSAALASGITDDHIVAIAKDVAAAEEHQLIRDLAMELDPAEASSLDVVTQLDPRQRARRLRNIVAKEPRNAVRWIDLAREQTILGSERKAEQSIRIATALQPDDRFVLRSASAFYAELGDFDRALAPLQRSDRTPRDPWLLSSMIALTELAERKVHQTASAKRMVEWGEGSRHIAELAAALGTLELRAGADRKARGLLRSALVAPTENALAQIEWISDRFGRQVEYSLDLSPPRAWEADARREAADGNWTQAQRKAHMWYLDQPFSHDAAVFGAFCSCEAGDWDAALEFTAAEPLVSDSTPLLNNRAYALIQLGDFAKALSTLTQAMEVKPRRHDGTTLLATVGLFLMRVGMVERGRSSYERSIRRFMASRYREGAAKAALLLALEELRLGTDQGNASVSRALRLAESVQRQDVVDLRGRVERVSRGVSQQPRLPIPSGDWERLAEPLLALPSGEADPD